MLDPRLCRSFVLLSLLTACGPSESPVRHRGDCTPGFSDFWRVHGPVQGSLSATLDVEDGAAFTQPSLSVWTVADWGRGVIDLERGERLDTDVLEAACSDLGIIGLCPSLVTTADVAAIDTGDLLLLVDHALCSSDRLDYVLIVESDGAPLELTHEGTGIQMGIRL
jgi:hypothetical protein